jgi:ribonuclease HI
MSCRSLPKKSRQFHEIDAQVVLDIDETYFANFDGLCEPLNPGGVATYGVIIRKGTQVVFQESGLASAKPWSKEASNNVAEYSAAIRALQWFSENGLEKAPIVFRGDSKLIINQLNGTFKVKAPRIVELHRQAAALLAQFSNIRLEWVDRSKNSEADILSRIAYRKYRAESRPRRPTQTAFNEKGKI